MNWSYQDWCYYGYAYLFFKTRNASLATSILQIAEQAAQENISEESLLERDAQRCFQQDWSLKVEAEGLVKLLEGLKTSPSVSDKLCMWGIFSKISLYVNRDTPKDDVSLLAIAFESSVCREDFRFSMSDSLYRVIRNLCVICSIDDENLVKGSSTQSLQKFCEVFNGEDVSRQPRHVCFVGLKLKEQEIFLEALEGTRCAKQQLNLVFCCAQVSEKSKSFLSFHLAGEDLDPSMIVFKMYNELGMKDIDKTLFILSKQIWSEDDIRRWKGVLTCNDFGAIVLAKHVSFEQCSHAIMTINRILPQYLSTSEHIFLLAGQGLIPEHLTLEQNIATFSCCWVRSKSFSFRKAMHEDIGKLVRLEDFWSSAGLRTNQVELESRMERGLVIVSCLNSEIVSVIYSQMISSVEDLKNVTYSDLKMVSNSNGKVMQLIAVLSDTSVTSFGISNTLVEFSLLIAKTLKVESVVAVTRWKSFQAWKKMHPEKSCDDYFIEDSDSTVNWHKSRGAKKLWLVKGYRPQDTDNEGIGVLIAYDVNKHEKESRSRFKMSRSELESVLVSEAIVLGKAKSGSSSTSFFDFGLDSLDLYELGNLVGKKMGISRPAIGLFFKYSTPKELASYLIPASRTSSDIVANIVDETIRDTVQKKITGGDSIQSLGISRGRGLSKLYRSLSQKLGSIVKVSDLKRESTVDDIVRASLASVNEQSSWKKQVRQKRVAIHSYSIHIGAFDTSNIFTALEGGIDGISKSERKNLHAFQGAFLGEAFLWNIDLLKWGVSPRETRLMDPQQKMLLWEAWEALEQSNVSNYDDVGVFVGLWNVDFKIFLKNERDDFHFATGSSASISAGRIAYLLNLKGPCLVADTACSSSMVALNVAKMNLERNECQYALVGSANVILCEELYHQFSSAGMLSPKFRCKTFDESADGYVRSEASCALVMSNSSRLTSANGFVLSCVANQDGRSGGLTVPNQSSQVTLHRKAIEASSKSADDFLGVECHGTGTPLGDPIEVHGLVNVFFSRSSPIMFGSVKSNFGHTESCSGLVGFISALTCAQKGLWRRQIHFGMLNPEIGDLAMEMSSCVIPREEITIISDAVFSVNNFGFSGTNCTAVIETNFLDNSRVTATKFSVLVGISNKHFQADIHALMQYLIEASTTEYELSSRARFSKSDYFVYLKGPSRNECKMQLSIIGNFPIEKPNFDCAIFLIPGAGWRKRIFMQHTVEEARHFCRHDLRHQRMFSRDCIIRPSGILLLADYTAQLVEGIKCDTHSWGCGKVVERILAGEVNTDEIVVSESRNFTFEKLHFDDGAYILESGRTSIGKRCARRCRWIHLLCKDYEVGIVEHASFFKKNPLSRGNFFLFHQPQKEDLSIKAAKPAAEYGSSTPLLESIRQIFQETLGLDKILDDDIFAEQGLDSFLANVVARNISDRLGFEVKATDFFSNPTLRTLSMSLNMQEPRFMSEMQYSQKDTAFIAGVSCYVGECRTISSFFTELLSERDFVSHIPTDRWKVSENSPNWGCFMVDPFTFDSKFFRISTREAMSCDPQQLLVLEASCEAINFAGLTFENLREAEAAVYLGIEQGEFLLEFNGTDHFLATGYSDAIAAGRVSYFLGLTGPALSINTACSSSLVALSLGVAFLSQGHRFALCGGVKLLMSGKIFDSLSKAGMLSPTGRCKTFDESADGYVRGEGCFQTLLDSKGGFCQIDACGVNQDGFSNGLTAPNGGQQIRLYRETISKCGRSCEEVEFIEMHGTGTSLGDPIETFGVCEVYGKRKSRCPVIIKSVKANIGHAETAAGLSALVSILTFVNLLPKQLHMQNLNSKIGRNAIEDAQIVIPLETVQKQGSISALSSFGYSGTNCHVILRNIWSKNFLDERFSSGFLDKIPELRLSSDFQEYIAQTGRYLERKIEKFPFCASNKLFLFEYVPPLCFSRLEYRQSMQKFGSSKRIDEKESHVILSVDQLSRLYCVDDHQVFGTPVMPGALHISMIVQHLIRRWNVIEVLDFLIQKPVFVLEIETMQYIFREENDEINIEARIFFKNLSDEQIVFSCVSRSSFEYEPDRGHVRLAQYARPQIWNDLDGLKYGPSFHWISEFYLDETKFSSSLVPPREWTQRDWKLAPELLDSVFQSSLFLGSKNCNLIPYTAKSVTYFGTALILKNDFSLEGEVTSQTSAKTTLDVSLRNADKLLVNVKALTLLEVSGSKFTSKSPTELADFFSISWKPIKLTAEEQCLKDSNIGLFGSDAGFVRSVRGKLSETTKVVIEALPTLRSPILLSILGIEKHKSLKVLLSHFLQLCKCLFKSKEVKVFVNCISNAFGPNSSPFNRSLWSVSRVACLESRSPKTIVWNVTSLDDVTENLQKTCFSKELIHGSEIRWGRGICQLSQLEKKMLAKETTIDFEFQSGLIMGFGGLGRALLEVFSKRKTFQSLIVSSRSGMSENDNSRRSAKILSCRVDVVKDNSDGSWTTCSRLAIGWAEPSRIFHLAGVLQDRLLTTISELKSVSPKVLGLRALKRSFPSSTTFLFSSIASAFGNIGQALYAAANGFLDGFASRCKNAISLQWGPLSFGMYMRLTEQQKLKGFEPLKVDSIYDAIVNTNGRIDDISEVCITKANWSEIDRESFCAPILNALCPSFHDPSKDEQAFSLKEIEGRVEKVVRELCLADDLTAETTFFDLGFDSGLSIELQKILSKEFSIRLGPTIAFDFSNVASLSQEIFGMKNPTKVVRSEQITRPFPLKRNLELQIGGLSCRVSSARSPRDLWTLLLKPKIDHINLVPKSRFNWEIVYDRSNSAGTSVSKWGCFIENIEYFDSDFFGITPREAAATDPKFRMLLECAWEAAESSVSYPYGMETRIGGPVGVYVGTWPNEYYDTLNDDDSFRYLAVGTSPAAGSGRVSFHFNLTGACVSIDTACSSSLVALHAARIAQEKQDEVAALVFGTNSVYSGKYYVMMSQAGMLCADGRCKTFDKRANGYVRGEACCGAFVSCSLKNSLCHVISTGVNQDGKSQSLTSPSGSSQKKLFASCIQQSSLDVNQIKMVECHGTGTSLGDPIEVTATVGAYGRKSSSFMLGSIKTNFGHTETTAGLLGLFKLVLMLTYKSCPSNCNFSTLNPHISDGLLENSCAILPLEAVQISADEFFASLSSFGFSGTNSHMIVGGVTLSDRYGRFVPFVLLSCKKEESKLQALERNMIAESTISELVVRRYPMFRKVLCFGKLNSVPKDLVGNCTFCASFPWKSNSASVFIKSWLINETSRAISSKNGEVSSWGALLWSVVLLRQLKELNINFSANSVGAFSSLDISNMTDDQLESQSEESVKRISWDVRSIQDSVVIESGRGMRSYFKDQKCLWLNGFKKRVSHPYTILQYLSDCGVCFFGGSVGRIDLPVLPFSKNKISRPVASKVTCVNFAPTMLQTPSVKNEFQVQMSWESVSKEVQDMGGLVHIGVWIDMILFCAKDIVSEESCKWGFDFLVPLILHPGSHFVDVCIKFPPQGSPTSGVVEIFSKQAGKVWVKNVIASFSTLDQKVLHHVEKVRIPNLKREKFYERDGIQELHIGSSMQVIDEFLCEEKHTFATILSHHPRSFSLPFATGVLDGCAQLLLLRTPKGYQIMTNSIFDFKISSTTSKVDTVFVAFLYKTDVSGVVTGFYRDESGSLVELFRFEISVTSFPSAAKGSNVTKFLSESTGLTEAELLSKQDDSLAQLGIDSLVMASVSSFMVDGRRAGPETLIRDILKLQLDSPGSYFASSLDSSSSAWVLYCFPYGGGDDSSFRQWMQKSAHVDVVPVLLPGRGRRISERLEENIEILVANICSELASIHKKEKKVAFYGHSFGALLAYCCATKLQKDRIINVELVCIGGFSAPIFKKNPILQTIEKSSKSKREFLNIFGIKSDSEILFRILQADVACVSSFFYDSSSVTQVLECPILAFSAHEDPVVTEESVVEWKNLTTEKFSHFSMQTRNHLFIDEFSDDLFSTILEHLKSL